MITVELIPILQDNYCYLLTSGNDVAIVDPGDAAPVLDILKQRGLTATKILVTHHHGDHTAGIADIKKAHGCTVYGPAKEAEKIDHLDILLKENDTVSIGNEDGIVIETSGHTAGHITYHFPHSKLLFAGDTLFSLGCGRLFEGTPDDMFASLNKLKLLPDDTLLYCGHEYTRANAAFLLSVAPDHAGLKKKAAEIAHKMPTLPSTLGEEKTLNLFLQCETAEAFAALRRLKDQY